MSSQAGNANAQSGRPAVFLDRDGTINVEVDYLSDPEQLELIPGAGAAIARLNRAQLPVVVVTNQSGVARGLLSEERLAEIHTELERQLAACGARLDLILYCPDHPEVGQGSYRRDSPRRKPGSGMLLEAQASLGLDLSRSWIVGDAGRDLAAGLAVGTRAILVSTGKGAREHERLSETAELRYKYSEDLAAAVDHILAQMDARAT